MRKHRFIGLLSSGYRLAAMVIIGLGVVFILLMANLPSVSDHDAYRMQIPLQVYTHDGVLMGEYGQMHRLPVALDQVPLQLIQAIIAIEDRHFYQHAGINVLSLMRAIRQLIITGRKSQGASTITMQVARNFFLTAKKTYGRKISEILLAIKLERYMTKSAILSLYLNKIYFGEKAYGVEAAARNYYGKSLRALTLPQMAMIAGLPQAPSRNNPIINPTMALKRRNQVLRAMLQMGYIDQATCLQAMASGISAKRHRVSIAQSTGYAADMARQAMVKRYGHAAYGMGLKVITTIDSHQQQLASQAIINGLYAYDKRHDYRVPMENLHRLFGDDQQAWIKHLKHQSDIPKAKVAAVVEVNGHGMRVLLADGKMPFIDHAHIPWIGSRYDPSTWLAQHITYGDRVDVAIGQDGQWTLSQQPRIQGALLSVNPKNGRIKAMVGGFNDRADHFNRTTQAWRQPGSVFKPFLVAAALEKGYTLASMINDAPIVRADSGINALWRPENDNKRFYGPTRLRMGLIKSRNLVAIRLLESIGTGYAWHFIKRFGFDMSRQPKSLSLALGAGEVNLLQLVQAYAIIANTGRKVEPYLIDRIEDHTGRMLIKGPLLRPNQYPSFQDELHAIMHHSGHNDQDQAMKSGHLTSFDQKDNDLKADQIVSSPLQFLLHQALKDVVQHGTARRLRSMGRQDLAGKTGTTNNKQDTWFAGYGGNLATVVWAGFDHMASTREFASTLALPIWKAYMSRALQDQPLATFEQPSDIIVAKINPLNGQLAHNDQPNSIHEFFRRGHLPNMDDQPFVKTSKSGSQDDTLLDDLS